MLQSRHRLSRLGQTSATYRQPRQNTITERRSPSRPQFLPGWRKTIPGGAENRPAAIGPKAGSSVSVWTSQVATLLAASNALNLLTDDDRISLQAYRSPEQRDTATAARILLRLSLSLMVTRRRAPNEWRFERTRFGKPFVRDDNEAIDFSVSHADQVVMVAIGRNVKLGVDVESVDQPIEDKVVDDFCHDTETQALQSLPQPRRARSFIQLWTQKEAYTKMLGVGHFIDFDSFSLEKIQENGDPTSRHIVEEFYFSLKQSLYHASLVINPQRPSSPIDVQLMTAVAPGRAACALSPPPLTNLS
jgi:phosphopantetheinyl transferase